MSHKDNQAGDMFVPRMKVDMTQFWGKPQVATTGTAVFFFGSFTVLWKLVSATERKEKKPRSNCFCH